MSEEIKNQEFRLMTYFAGAIEHCSKKEAVDFRKELWNKLFGCGIIMYDPIRQESKKVGKETGEHIEYIKGLKRAGHKELFYDAMHKIWWGKIKQNSDPIQVLTNLRMRRHIDGNKLEEIQHYGDFEAVVRSDFIIVHLPNSVKTVGTIFEVMAAFLFKIPIYLIVPDAPATEINSSLLYGTQISNGDDHFKVYRTINECVKAIKEDYKIK